MTTSDIPTDASATLHQVLSKAEAVLLDFDGPICSIFTEVPSSYAAAYLRQVLASNGRVRLPTEIEETEDPFVVFHYARLIGANEAAIAERALRECELEAVIKAKPTADAHQFMTVAATTGRKLAIVSNNSAAAVEAYIAAHDLARYVDVVQSRTESDPDLLKPNPYLVRNCVRALDVHAARSVFIGDSPSDMFAAKAAGVPGIAYLNKPSKRSVLENSSPIAIVTAMKILTANL